MLESPIRPAMRSPLQQALDRIGSAPAVWTPATLFAASEQGVWYDPSDFSTLFQDSAGTTPVTATGQVVGLMLDKSRGLALGSELVTNGDFSNGTTGWTVGTGGNAATLSNISGVLRSTSTTSYGQCFPSSALATQVGKWYELTFTVVTQASGVGVFRVGTFSGLSDLVTTQSISASGVKHAIFMAASTTSFLWIENGGTVGGYTEIDSVSVREIPGNHATQATTASKPILQQDANGKYYLAFDGVDDGMATAAVNFTATDKMSVFAGVLFSSTAIQEVFGTTSAAAASGSVSIQRSSNIVGRLGYYAVTNAGGLGPLYEAAISSSVNYVAGMILDVAGASAATEIFPRLNAAVPSVTAAGGAAVGTGNFYNLPIYIGRRGGSDFPLNGRIYQLIIRGALTDAAGITAAETFVNTKTAAY